MLEFSPMIDSLIQSSLFKKKRRFDLRVTLGKIYFAEGKRKGGLGEETIDLVMRGNTGNPDNLKLMRRYLGINRFRSIHHRNDESWIGKVLTELWVLGSQFVNSNDEWRVSIVIHCNASRWIENLILGSSWLIVRSHLLSFAQLYRFLRATLYDLYVRVF